MNQLQQQKPKPSTQSHGQVNPFARALAETEKSDSQKGNTLGTPPAGLDAFRQALQNAQHGEASNNSGSEPAAFSQEDWLKQQAELKKQQERAALRKKLHDQINPVDTQSLFDARDKQVKDQIDHLRKELKALSVEVAEFNKEVEVTLLTKISKPGERGVYYISFFQQLRSFIMLLRQKISSARTWLQSFKGKQSKKPGMQVKGQGFQQTKVVQDMMQHERSSSYAGA